jgi:hypothetical protein
MTVMATIIDVDRSMRPHFILLSCRILRLGMIRHVVLVEDKMLLVSRCETILLVRDYCRMKDK